MPSKKKVSPLRRDIRNNRLSKRSKKARGLVVFTHGFRSKPADYEDLLVQLLTDKEGHLTDCDLLPFKYRSWGLSNTRFDHSAGRQYWWSRWARYAAEELDAKIQEADQERKYEKIYLVGHSLGGILIRSTVVVGWEGIGSAPPKDRWVSKIERLVLLAATNRGIAIEGFWARLGYVLARLCGRATLLRDAMRESEFMNNLRLGWIVKFQRKGRTPPRIVQLLGDRDDTVGQYDSADVDRFETTEQIPLPGVGHADFKRLEGVSPPPRLLSRLTGSCPALSAAAYATIRDAFKAAPSEPAVPRPPVAVKPPPLIFLIHGIRDFGGWQSTLARHIYKLEPKARVVPIRYGYFNIFQFLLGFQRFRAVRSFTDRYIEEVAGLDCLVDEIKIVVGAHSNGTYVLANALEKYNYMCVDRIYLAGSVLPRRFPWHGVGAFNTKKERRLEVVRNDCANQDWAVGILCSALRWLFLWRAIGVAGYQGFETVSQRPAVKNYLYLEGGHGEAFQPNRQAGVAKYLLYGEPDPPEELRTTPETPEKWYMWASFRGAIALLGLVIWGLGLLYSGLIPWLGGKVQAVSTSLYSFVAGVLPADVTALIPTAAPGTYQIGLSAIVTVVLILLLVRI